MMQAAESGTAARQRATEGLTRQHAVGFEQGQQIARLGAQTAEAGERLKETKAQREQQRKIAVGSQMLQQRGLELSEAERGYERAPGGEELPMLRQEREQRTADGMAQGTAAEAPPGQPPAAPGGAAPPGMIGPPAPETSPRTPEEVSRLQQQGEMPVEIGAAGAAQPGMQEPGGLRLSPVGERRERREDYEAETRRLAVQARFAANQNRAAQAEFANDKVALKQIKEGLDIKLEQQSDLFSRVRNGKTTFADWKAIKVWAQEMNMNDAPDGGQLMQIIDQASKNNLPPMEGEAARRLQGFLEGYMDHSAMQYTMTLGMIPEQVNTAGPMFRAYQAAQDRVIGLMQIVGPSFQQHMNIKTYQERIKFQNRWAAMQVLTGKAGMVGGGSFGGQPQAPPGAGAQPGAQPGAPGAQAAPQQISPGTLEDQRQFQQRGEALGMPTTMGGLAREVAGAERPGMPAAAPESARVSGRQYEYPTPEGGGEPVQRSRTGRVHAERREEKFRELQEGGHEEAAAALRNVETEVDVIGETDTGVPVLNTIPAQSNPDKWEWTEYEPGEFGWIGLARKKTAAERKARTPVSRGRAGR